MLWYLIKHRANFNIACPVFIILTLVPCIFLLFCALNQQMILNIEIQEQKTHVKFQIVSPKLH